MGTSLNLLCMFCFKQVILYSQNYLYIYVWLYNVILLTFSQRSFPGHFDPAKSMAHLRVHISCMQKQEQHYSACWKKFQGYFASQEVFQCATVFSQLYL